MRSKFLFHRIGLPIAFTSLVLVLIIISASAQSDTQPVTIHTACSGNCVADLNFLHSSMGDTSAKESFHHWFDTAYRLTDCGENALKTDVLFLIDVFADSVGAPGGNTMQCWQMLAAQGAQCGDSCSEYFIEDAEYGPNVQVTLGSAGPGSLEVNLDNSSNMGNLPELEPNAYSRRFHLKTSLQLNGGTWLLLNDSEIPSLSYPNWITRGGYDDCISGYGSDTTRCKLLEYFLTSNAYSQPISFYNGALYDLSEQVYSLSDANGSFSQDGFIRLLSDGDSITIKQGPFAGLVWVKTHNKSNDNHSQTVYAWDASAGDVEIANSECNTTFSTCWMTGDRTESDTYVFALQGPSDKILSGTYTVQTTADIPHEKDLSDNTVSYSYDAEEVGDPQTQSDDSTDLQDDIIPLSDLAIIELPGPGTYSGTIPEGMPGVMYHLHVPEDISFMYLQLLTIQSGGFEFFTRLGSIPVPGFPYYENGEYDRYQISDAELSGGLPFEYPPEGDYYIFIDPWLGEGTSFELKLEWNTRNATSTPTVDGTQFPPSGQDGGDSMNEVESNNTAATANSWGMTQPFTGQISRWNDKDYVQLNFTESGIYTYSLRETGENLKARLTLMKKLGDNSSLSVDSASATTAGEDFSLTFDASAGEVFYLQVSAIGMASDVNDQPYQLSLTGFVPDPFESNDDHDQATAWDLSNGLIKGYFWDQASGSADYYSFTAPTTIADSDIVFTVTNPSPQMRIRISLTRSNGVSVEHTSFLPAGQAATLSTKLVPGQQYFLKLDVMGDATSLTPYQLNASYVASGEEADLTSIESHPVRIHGRAYRQWLLLQIPLREVEIYIQVNRQPAILLDTTKWFGTYSETIDLKEGQQVQIWAMKDGFVFDPPTETWTVTEIERSLKSNFVGVEDEELYDTELPPSDTVETQTLQNTTNTPIPSTEEVNLTVSGTVWRLFSTSAPAGVGAAQLLLTVNGVSQPVVYSMIDGTYTITVSGLQPGDQLSLKAKNPEDVFEPPSYDWVAEAGAENYAFDFFSYWENSGSAEEVSQNHFYGRITDASDQGVAGLNVILRVGDSDALQFLASTDTNGYYEATVDLPSRIMITFWVEMPGYSPSSVKFFHAYASENRELNFTASP